MPDNKLTTSKLLSRLFRTRNLSRYFSVYKNEMNNEPLNVYLGRLCDERDTIPANIIKKAGIERAYGYHLFNGTKKNPSRDIVLQLAFGFDMDFDETQKLLKAADLSVLSPRVERDAVIIYALSKKHNIYELQGTLKELNLPLLGKEDKYE